MIEQAEHWAIPWLIFLVEWSVRWGIVIGVLAVWLRLRPPRKTALRHLLCLAALAVGFLLPFAPRWGVGFVTTSSRSTMAADSAEAAAPRSSRADSSGEGHAGPTTAGKRELQERARDTVSHARPGREAAGYGGVRARSTPLDWWRLAALALWAVWVAVVLILVVRLAGGWLALWRLRREAVELGGESARLVDECRRALGLSRPVRLATHAGVISPAVVAGRRSVVLVPADWIEWPESHRRACLLHELAHLARYDDWTKLAQEFLRIPLFFHPLVRWLLARLDLARELLGDLAAVGLGRFDRVAYARLLLEMARRPGRLVPVVRLIRQGALPFLEGKTVEVRIKRLLEENIENTFSRPSVVGTLVLGGLIVVAALVISGLRVRKFVPNSGVPPVVGDVIALHGRLVDATGAPISGATLVGSYEGRMLRRFMGTEPATDARGEFRGEFRLLPSPNRAPAPGARVRLIGRLRDGAEFETVVVLSADGAVTLKLPLDVKAPEGVAGPREAARGELAGRVVDAEGKPIEGALADAWTFFPGNEAKTDKEGFFRLAGLDKFEQDPKVEVVVRKAGYTPQFFLAQPTGQTGWVIVLRNKTYFEGQVTGPDGKPVAGARVRANCGPKLTAGEVWNEATTGEDGRYRMYAQADVYDFQVRVPGVGAARRKDTVLGLDEAKALDIRLEPALTFRAKLVDSISGKPISGVRLRGVGSQPGIEGRSGPDGVVAIAEMMPGRFDFQVETSEYGRWWSDESVNSSLEWQRDFDNLDFDLTPGMQPVTITLERAATVSGRVVDPDGKPVAGATVDPALTGTFNSLTGDTRFAVRTGDDGTFKLVLPASGVWEYNLVAHDGKYLEWRRWANGVLPPLQTEPGEVVPNVEIKLSRPAIVRGRVIGPDGQPVAGREVRASAADRLENRYYDPTVTTADDGSYELKFVRAGEQFIQVAPFWLDARQAPEGTSQTVNLAPGETKDGVDFPLQNLSGAN